MLVMAKAKKPTAAQRLTAFRDARDLTQGEFADKLDISVRTLQNWEQGRTKPDRRYRKLLKSVFQFDFDAK